MRLKSIELSGFKSFAKKTPLVFGSAITSVVGPNGSGKSNIAESFRFVLGEQSMKSMRGKRGEDLIWNGGVTTPRAGRASVKLIFDNSDRELALDFDEVAIERVVYRDGANDYLLNGSTVRLRDIAELLSQANIGASGHHIISQGEADRVLTASVKERREMIEDALGLTAFLYKREEAERKMEKTAENVREVESLRRELAPHVKFLTAQVKKIEEGSRLQNEIAERYAEYLKRESMFIHVEEEEIRSAEEGPRREHAQLEASILHLRHELNQKHGEEEPVRELMRLEEEGRTLRGRREEISRELGRIEGELAASARITQTLSGTVPAAQAEEFATRVLNELQETLTFGELDKLKAKLNALVVLATEFMRRLQVLRPEAHAHQSAESLAAKKTELEHELEELARKEIKVREEVDALRKKIESKKDASREAERELFQAMAKRSELEVTLAGMHARADALARLKENFTRELGEAGALIGASIGEYAAHVVLDAHGQKISDEEIAHEPREVQEERRRKLERGKIKLEELGAGNSAETLKEYKETTEREQFLARELADLEASAAKLREIIEELTKTLESRFAEGVAKINKEFDEFFRLMFGGGGASLAIVEEQSYRRGGEEGNDADVEVEEGIEISVNIPHKRVKGIHMLSGGERALISIALIFAMSQVNPPPFLILDETDAALDEANSRRYGDMIENLSKKSQLILITHNRETMSRAGVLYGVTMGSDGVSKLLSVKFEEALAVAK
ncbi:MAG TPA: AAA family ATPase [Candidatus Paceibacterota bacterium]|nr:AAA family ATPase [Candidatus Paceibacterota bacterium]